MPEDAKETEKELDKTRSEFGVKVKFNESHNINIITRPKRSSAASVLLLIELSVASTILAGCTGRLLLRILGEEFINSVIKVLDTKGFK